MSQIFLQCWASVFGWASLSQTPPFTPSSPQSGQSVPCFHTLPKCSEWQPVNVEGSQNRILFSKSAPLPGLLESSIHFCGWIIEKLLRQKMRWGTREGNLSRSEFCASKRVSYRGPMAVMATCIFLMLMATVLPPLAHFHGSWKLLFLHSSDKTKKKKKKHNFP